MENTRFIKCLCKGLGFNSEEVFEQKPFIMKSLLPMCDTTFFEKLKLQSCHQHTQSSSDWSHWSKRDMYPEDIGPRASFEVLDVIQIYYPTLQQLYNMMTT